MSVPITALAALAADPPEIPEADIARAVDRHFGLLGEYSPLVSERDQNLLLRVQNGDKYVVKVTGPSEPSVTCEFQTSALVHIAAIRALQTPRVVRTLDGLLSTTIEHNGESCRLRVVSYVAGELMASVSINAGLARDFGARLAGLDRALAGFSHAGERPVLLWDLQRATELKSLFGYIDDPTARERVAGAIDDFENRVLPGLAGLRTQVIHGDANPENVLIDAAGHRVSGIIDFGDMLRAPLVFDPAIAAAYLRPGGEEPLELIAPFMAGYQDIIPLTDSELALLFDAIRARLATTITLLFWRLAARGDDDPYREKTLGREGDALRFLTALERLGRVAFQQRLREVA